MEPERRAILHLLAMGRVTPREAERLLVVANEGREGHWMFAAAIALAAIARLDAGTWLAQLDHAVTAMLPGSFAVVHHVTSIVVRTLGGSL